jgi:WD40 repeat protein
MVDQAELVLAVGHVSTVQSLAFSPDGALLVTTALDGKILLWSTETGELLREWDPGWISHDAMFSPDGSTLVTSEAGLTFRNVRTGAWEGCLSEVDGPMHLTPDGKALIGSDREGLLLVDCQSGELLSRLPFDDQLEGEFRGIVFSADGTTAVVWDRGFPQSGIRVWNIPAGTCEILEWPDLTSPAAVAVSPDGRWLVLTDMNYHWICATAGGTLQEFKVRT